MRSRFVALIAFSLAALLALAGPALAQDGANGDVPRWVESDYELSIDESFAEVLLDGRVDIHEAETPNDRRIQRLCGSSCSADELREAYQRADQSGKDQLVATIESRVEDEIRTALEGLAAEGTTPTADATVSRESLAAPYEDARPFHPPIPVNATGSAQLGLLSGTDYTSDQVEALFQMGARVSQPIDQEVSEGTNLTLTIDLPGPVDVVETDEGETGSDEGSVTYEEANWDSSSSAQIQDDLLLGNPDVHVPSQADAGVNITLDISSVDVNYGGLLGGGAPADADVRLAVDGRFSAIENPQDVDRVELPYLSADAIRIAIANDLLDEKQITSFEDQTRKQIKASFQELFGKKVDVTGGIPASELRVDRVGDPPGTGAPIVLAMDASARVDFPPPNPGSGGTTAGLTVKTISLGSLPLPNLDTPGDVPAQVTLILPDGLELRYDDVQGANITESEIDGRKAYTFSSTSSDGEATVQNAGIAVKGGFVWDLFWPLILFLFLLLVVLPAVVIGLAIQRRREEDEGPGGGSSSPVAGSQSSQRGSSGD